MLRPSRKKRERFQRVVWLGRGKAGSLHCSFIKVCDKNPVSADFYGSNMRGKLTDAPNALHPTLRPHGSKARGDRR